MLRRILAAAVATVALLTAACDDSTSPEGSRSVATVHAYVDVDGSAGISDGDDFISGLSITLQDADGVTETATTNPFGVALFPSLRPGSYTVTATGTVPEGAVLATASEPVLVAPFRGDSVAQEFRYVYNPGSLSGALFRDNNSNGVYDAGDTPAPGMPVRLFAGTDTTAAPVAADTTADDGTFSFAVLRPGDYTLVVTPIPTIQVVGGNAQAVTIEPNAPTEFGVQFTGNLIQTIAEVRAAGSGQIVAFEGIATVSVNVFSSNQTSNQFNVQDATGGILVLQVPVSSGIQQGDSVRVIGTTAISSGEFLVTGNPTVTRLASGRPVPAPVTITAARVAASTPAEPLQGSLVEVERVRVDSLGSGATAYNVFVTGEDGAPFIVRVSSGVPRDTWTIDSRYDIVGTLAAFNAPQVKVRGAGDVTAASSSTPIAQARLLSAGTVVTVEGVATAGVGVFSTNPTSNQFNVQDATGGILILQVPLTSGVQRGDSVRVTGTVAVSGGELLLTTNPTVTILGSGHTLPAPRLITAAQVAASTSADPVQGSLVHVRNITVDSLGSGTTAYNVFVSEGASRFIVRVSTGIPRDTWTVGESYNVTGTLAQFNAPQVKVRDLNDISAADAPLPIGIARQMPAATLVTVEGIVTAPVGVFSTSASGNQFNVQDPTGGILALQTPLASGIALGDSVRVTGTTAISSGEFLLTSNPTVTILANGRAVPAPLLLSAADIAASDATDPEQGSLVRVENVTVDSVGAGTTAYNVFVTGEDGASFIVRVGTAAVGIDRTFWAAGSSYDVTGTLGNFNGPQIKLRMASDATAVAGGEAGAARRSNAVTGTINRESRN